jgi:RNA polymerase sigma factor (sigma-70 family)
VHSEAQQESDDEWAARGTRAVRSGSHEALAEIYDRCAEEVVVSVERATRRDESFALDCLQEMFMRLAAHPPVVDSHAALMAWMRVAVLNVARNMVVSEQRRRRREGAVVSAPDRGAGYEGRESLDAILRQLDEDERTLVRLRHVEGMRIKAIAQAIGATPQAIESTIRRAIGRLRQGGAS